MKFHAEIPGVVPHPRHCALIVGPWESYLGEEDLSADLPHNSKYSSYQFNSSMDEHEGIILQMKL